MEGDASETPTPVPKSIAAVNKKVQSVAQTVQNLSESTTHQIGQIVHEQEAQGQSIQMLREDINLVSQNQDKIQDKIGDLANHQEKTQSDLAQILRLLKAKTVQEPQPTQLDRGQSSRQQGVQGDIGTRAQPETTLRNSESSDVIILPSSSRQEQQRQEVQPAEQQLPSDNSPPASRQGIRPQGLSSSGRAVPASNELLGSSQAHQQSVPPVYYPAPYRARKVPQFSEKDIGKQAVATQVDDMHRFARDAQYYDNQSAIVTQLAKALPERFVLGGLSTPEEVIQYFIDFYKHPDMMKFFAYFLSDNNTVHQKKDENLITFVLSVLYPAIVECKGFCPLELRPVIVGTHKHNNKPKDFWTTFFTHTLEPFLWTDAMNTARAMDTEDPNIDWSSLKTWNNFLHKVPLSGVSAHRATVPDQTEDKKPPRDAPPRQFGGTVIHADTEAQYGALCGALTIIGAQPITHTDMANTATIHVAAPATTSTPAEQQPPSPSPQQQQLPQTEEQPPSSSTVPVQTPQTRQQQPPIPEQHAVQKSDRQVVQKPNRQFQNKEGKRRNEDSDMGTKLAKSQYVLTLQQIYEFTQQLQNQPGVKKAWDIIGAYINKLITGDKFTTPPPTAPAYVAALQAVQKAMKDLPDEFNEIKQHVGERHALLVQNHERTHKNNNNKGLKEKDTHTHQTTLAARNTLLHSKKKTASQQDTVKQKIPAQQRAAQKTPERRKKYDNSQRRQGQQERHHQKKQEKKPEKKQDRRPEKTQEQKQNSRLVHLVCQDPEGKILYTWNKKKEVYEIPSRYTSDPKYAEPTLTRIIQQAGMNPKLQLWKDIYLLHTDEAKEFNMPFAIRTKYPGTNSTKRLWVDKSVISDTKQREMAQLSSNKLIEPIHRFIFPDLDTIDSSVWEEGCNRKGAIPKDNNEITIFNLTLRHGDGFVPPAPENDTSPAVKLYTTGNKYLRIPPVRKVQGTTVPSPTGEVNKILIYDMKRTVPIDPGHPASPTPQYRPGQPVHFHLRRGFITTGKDTRDDFLVACDVQPTTSFLEPDKQTDVTQDSQVTAVYAGLAYHRAQRDIECAKTVNRTDTPATQAPTIHIYIGSAAQILGVKVDSAAETGISNWRVYLQMQPALEAMGIFLQDATAICIQGAVLGASIGTTYGILYDVPVILHPDQLVPCYTDIVVMNCSHGLLLGQTFRRQFLVTEEVKEQRFLFSSTPAALRDDKTGTLIADPNTKVEYFHINYESTQKKLITRINELTAQPQQVVNISMLNATDAQESQASAQNISNPSEQGPSAQPDTQQAVEDSMENLSMEAPQEVHTQHTPEALQRDSFEEEEITPSQVQQLDSGAQRHQLQQINGTAAQLQGQLQIYLANVDDTTERFREAHDAIFRSGSPLKQKRRFISPVKAPGGNEAGPSEQRAFSPVRSITPYSPTERERALTLLEQNTALLFLVDCNAPAQDGRTLLLQAFEQPHIRTTVDLKIGELKELFQQFVNEGYEAEDIAMNYLCELLHDNEAFNKERLDMTSHRRPSPQIFATAVVLYMILYCTQALPPVYANMLQQDTHLKQAVFSNSLPVRNLFESSPTLIHLIRGDDSSSTTSEEAYDYDAQRRHDITEVIQQSGISERLMPTVATALDKANFYNKYKDHRPMAEAMRESIRGDEQGTEEFPHVMTGGPRQAIAPERLRAVFSDLAYLMDCQPWQHFLSFKKTPTELSQFHTTEADNFQWKHAIKQSIIALLGQFYVNIHAYAHEDHTAYDAIHLAILQLLHQVKAPPPGEVTLFFQKLDYSYQETLSSYQQQLHNNQTFVAAIFVMRYFLYCEPLPYGIGDYGYDIVQNIAFTTEVPYHPDDYHSEETPAGLHIIRHVLQEFVIPAFENCQDHLPFADPQVISYYHKHEETPEVGRTQTMRNAVFTKQTFQQAAEMFVLNNRKVPTIRNEISLLTLTKILLHLPQVDPRSTCSIPPGASPSSRFHRTAQTVLRKLLYSCWEAQEKWASAADVPAVTLAFQVIFAHITEGIELCTQSFIPVLDPVGLVTVVQPHPGQDPRIDFCLQSATRLLKDNAELSMAVLTNAARSRQPAQPNRQLNE